MKKEEEVAFVTFDAAFKDRSYAWLSDPEIGRLVHAPRLTRESQQAWFDTLPRRRDYQIFGVAYNGIPVGAAGIRHMDQEKREGEFFCYIGEKAYWGRGIGRAMVAYCQRYALGHGLTDLWLTVTEENTRAAALYESTGFVLVGRLNGLPLYRWTGKGTI